MNYSRLGPIRAPGDEGAPGAPAPATPPAAPPAPSPPAAPPNQAPGAPAAPAGEPTQPAAPASPSAAYRPDGLPDHLFGGSDKETLDKLYGAYKGARDAIATRGEMPADAKAYDYKASDTVAPYAAGLGNDPFFGKVQDMAFAAGLSKPQFEKFINGVLGEMITGQMVEPPFNADKERELLAPGVTDPAQRAVAADRMAREAQARVEVWKGQGLPENVAADLLSRTDRAATVQLVNWIASRSRETMPAMGGQAAGGVTEAQLRERTADPRGRVGDPKYDKAFAAETDRLYKAFYPGGER